MTFTPQFLDDLRARLPVSEVVGRKVKLKKNGSELRAVDDNSLTVNDAKRLWWDHARDKEGGDIFDWFTIKEGLSFPQAVEECARLAGVAMPSGDGPREPRRMADRPVHNPPPDQDGDPGAGAPGDGGNDRGPRPAKEITRTYDYTDPQGSLIYQVCRIEWAENDKKKKTFIQRRPTPEGDGKWIWGLGAGEFVQGHSGDWFQVTKDREGWKGARRRITEVAEHGLYRLVEFAELRAPGEPTFILEGEKDVDTAVDKWQLVATTNSGGARHWGADHAEWFRDLDVVIPVDNDEAGRDRGEIIAKSLRGIARSIKILDWSAVWPEAPKGADLTDWRTYEEGTKDDLLAIVAGLPQWQPKPFTSQFGLIMWGEHNAPGEDYEYLVEDLIPEREAVLIQGESQSGKSFATQKLGMCGATGIDFFGHRVFKPFGVVYCAYEAGKGFRYRMRAHERFFDIEPGRTVPFGVLTKPIDLWSNEINTDRLIEEILGIAETRFGGVPLGAVVIDTHNRANPGASEIDSKDIGRIIDRYSKIMEKTRAGVWIIGHKNAAGKHRGNEQLYNNIETAIDISRKVQEVEKQKIAVTDDQRRAIRIATVIKQREGIDGVSFEFALSVVEVGTNRYGKPRTSCVAVPPAYGEDDSQSSGPTERKSSGKIELSAEQQLIFQALKRALEDNDVSIETPPALKLPKSIRRVVKKGDWKTEYLKIAPDAEQAKDNTINARMKRATEVGQKLRIMGVLNPYVWLTGRPVRGVVEPRPDFQDPYPGRPEPDYGDIGDLL